MSDKIIYIEKPKITKDKNGNNIESRVQSILKNDILQHQGKTKTNKLLAPKILISCERRIIIEDINKALKNNSYKEVEHFIENILNYNNDKCKEEILFIGNFDDINNAKIKQFLLEHTELNKRIHFIKSENFKNAIKEDKDKEDKDKEDKEDKEDKDKEDKDKEDKEDKEDKDKEDKEDKEDKDKDKDKKKKKHIVCPIINENFIKSAYQDSGNGYKVKDSSNYKDNINIVNIGEVFHIFSNKKKLNKNFFQLSSYKKIQDSFNAVEFLKTILKNKKRNNEYIGSRDKLYFVLPIKDTNKKERVYITDEVLNNFEYDNINNHLKYKKEILLKRNDELNAKNITLCPTQKSLIEELKTQEISAEEINITRVKDKNEYKEYLNASDDETKMNEETSSEVTKNNNDFLYPELDDENFNGELMKHKEFYTLNQTNIDANKKLESLEELQESLCSSEFELNPHQIFVKNFLSYHTPYNSLLLYHGLGTGKTCSAIGIAEEMRNYIKQIGFGSNKIKKIIIIASPNVQDNFKTQLFDESKLKQVDGIWRIEGCLGNSLLEEINPSERNDMTREKIIENIKRIINKYYAFYGYTKFGNIVKDEIEYKRLYVTDDTIKNQYKIKKIKQIFEDRLIIIDEAHNIRDSDDNGNREVHNQLKDIAKYTNNLKLLLLSGTPMYNGCEEIVWIANLLNINDKRKGNLKVKDIFETNGDFKTNGKEMLTNRLRGYISYVKGENPYTFPLRLACKNEIPLDKPGIQMNGITIADAEYNIVENMPIYYSKMNKDGVQDKAYNLLINEALKDDISNTKAFGYSLLQLPIESLNIVFGKKERLNELEKNFSKSRSEQKVILQSMLGEKGMSNTFTYEEKVVDGEKMKSNFKYIDPSYKIFDEEHLKNHSIKINNICQQIRKSTGIIMIYSQYIDGGVIPVALALEAMGFKRRVGNKIKNLFHKDSNPAKENNYKVVIGENDENSIEYTPHYIILTGDERYSPDNVKDLKNLNNVNNKNGEKIKVVIISRAAGEGVDFRNLRQVHIMEPWYNLSRTDQIIGRSIRNKSHCGLKFEERNVEIFLHATLNDEKKKNKSGEDQIQECADLYLYRYASNKAKQIGNVTKLLKENAVDCALRFGQYDDLNARLKIDQGETITIRRSSGEEEIIKTEDIKNNKYNNYTSICDYTDSCELKCASKLPDKEEVHMATYNIDFAKNNMEGIMKRVRSEFKNMPKGLFYFYHDDLFNLVNIKGNYTREQFDIAITTMIEDNGEILIDSYGRKGRLINKDKWYFFQPLEITDINISVFERSVPVQEVIRSFPAKQFETVGDDYIQEKETKRDKQSKQISDYDALIIKIKYALENSSTLISNKVQLSNADEYNKFNWGHSFLMLKPYIEKDIENDTLTQIIIEHYIDFLSFKNTKKLLEEFIKENVNIIDDSGDYNLYIKKYFDNRKIGEHYYLIQTIGKNKQPAFFKYENDNIIQERDVTTLKELINEFEEKVSVEPKNFFGFIESEIKLNKEEKIFKIREKNVSKNKKGSIVRGTYDKNENIMNNILETVNITNTMTMIKEKKKAPYITAALPILIEILLRYKNSLDKSKGSFLSIDEFYLFSESEK